MINKRGECLIQSASLVLNKTVPELKTAIGHDGTDSHIGFHMQEIIDYAFLIGVAVICIQSMPGSAIYGEPDVEPTALWEESVARERIMNYVDTNNGIIECLNKDGDYHAVAVVNCGLIDVYDINVDIDDLTIINFWIFKPMR